MDFSSLGKRYAEREEFCPCLRHLRSRMGLEGASALFFRRGFFDVARQRDPIGFVVRMVGNCPYCQPVDPAFEMGRQYRQAQTGADAKPPCQRWLKELGLGPLDLIYWMAGYAEESRAEGRSGPVDWLNGECRCERGCGQ